MKPLGFHVLDGLEDTLTSTALSESADSFGDSVSTWILCTLDSENRCRKDTEELSFKLGRKGGVMLQQRMGKANEKRIIGPRIQDGSRILWDSEVGRGGCGPELGGWRGLAMQWVREHHSWNGYTSLCMVFTVFWSSES